MSGLILPNEWTRQPQTPVGIDWGNPLAKGLRAAVSGISAYDFVTNKFLTVSGAFTKTATPYGVAHTTTAAAASTYIELPFEISGAVSVVTVVSRDVSATTTGTGKVAPVITNRTANQATFWEFNLGNGFGALGDIDKPRLSNDSAGFGTIYADGVALSGNNPVTTALTNGRFYTLAAVAASGATASGSGKMWLFAVLTASYFSLVGRMPLALVYDRALSAAEVKSLSDNPWQIFKSQSRRIWVGAAGGTNTAVNPGTGSIAITGYAPSIAQTANQAITPNVGNIVITGYAPTISQPQAVNPGVGSLTITGYAPTVTQNVDVPVNPGVGTIAITGYAPTVAQTANQSVLPATGTIAITGYSPTVSQSANQAVTPDVGTITITGYAPIVQQAPASQNITPDVGTITITGYAPTVEQSSPLRLGGFEYGSKVYIKRNKKIYIFDSVEEADSYLEAEAKAEEIVQQSNKTSRLARKRAREKAHKLLAIEPVESVDIPALKTLVAQLQTDFELPKLIAQQDWQRVVEIYNQAMEMQDEEDLLLIL